MDRLLQPWKYPSKDKFSNRPIWAPRPDLNQTQLSHWALYPSQSPSPPMDLSSALEVIPLSQSVNLTGHPPDPESHKTRNGKSPPITPPQVRTGPVLQSSPTGSNYADPSANPHPGKHSLGGC
ncbi:hypothetical protein PCH_Pc18g03380 [Penicillium rubens Wisconsin 54-1255]|uniref:Uncharacterized protein n=1 Tax=Penicillium rubens (strain ATCC 28089 / DSM 1075 / NRRL 1951 / Wisconsin 54-1255) TaxID=500485 RepID=B6HBA5_PENRW|nr:hypothetical protein PCH_Pc18g03380 [Penicillium rubens Wisconsin 54-1255]